jgi:hypothetical protein
MRTPAAESISMISFCDFFNDDVSEKLHNSEQAG